MAAVLKLLEYRTSSQLTYVTPSNKANKVNSGKVIDLVVCGFIRNLETLVPLSMVIPEDLSNIVMKFYPTLTRSEMLMFRLKQREGI